MVLNTPSAASTSSVERTAPAVGGSTGTQDSIRFPAGSGRSAVTTLVLSMPDDAYPLTSWVGPGERAGESQGVPVGFVAAAGTGRLAEGEPSPVGVALLPEHWRGSVTRPGLRGFRFGAGSVTGQAWSTRFRIDAVEAGASALAIQAIDETAGLQLATEVESVPGGALRIRHRLTNIAESAYLVEGLEVVIPVPDTHREVLDFTGRHERERFPQRHAITDGLWLREGRQGRTGLDAATMVVTGAPGFGFDDASVLAVHVAWSGNITLGVERGPAAGTTISAGEHLLPGEVALATGQSYTTPWVHVVATEAGLDGVADAFHRYLRAGAAHPGIAPVTLNVWEAVYFDHDLTRLRELAVRAAAIGVERFVLDDGWFHLRRHDHAGLGDWWVDPAAWPTGLTPLIDEVRSRGMVFGLWFEPEMVNEDSDVYRAHPDWILATGDRIPLLHRHQLVLDLSRDEVREYLFDQMSEVLSANDIGYVKWDHNRDLLDAGSAATAGAPVVHAQTIGFYRLLDDLRAAHPGVVWESCASGGGRIDLGVLERVERVWTSDMTDAMARQSIQRWTGQLVPPEYLGAHISAPTSHQTGRTYSLAFRAATALFGAFGIEWDISGASTAELDDLAAWIGIYKRHRDLLQTGRVVRIASSDPDVAMHGVVSADGREALVAHVQLDESAHNRGVVMRVPGLDPDAVFDASWVAPGELERASAAPPVSPAGPTDSVPVAGRVLAEPGLWFPRRRAETILLTHLRARD